MSASDLARQFGASNFTHLSPSERAEVTPRRICIARGLIDKVTIELKDLKRADRDDAEQARKKAALKKGLEG
jgi:hypothetical protein